jgi:uncharacterized membrane protein YfcA
MGAHEAREGTTDFAIGQLGAETYALIGIVCFLAAVVSGMSGFGTGLIISIFVAPLVGVQTLVPVMSVAMLFNNAGRLWAYFPTLDRRIFLVMMLSAIPASVLGAIVYVRLDTALISGMLGAVLIASVPLSRYLSRQQLRVGTATLAAVGGIFGFVSSIVLGAGMLVIAILLGLGLAGPALLATDAAIAVGTSLARMAMFGTLDALTVDLFLAGLLMGLCTIPGAWVAAWIMRRTDLRLHRLVVEALIVAGGLSFLWHAFEG